MFNGISKIVSEIKARTEAYKTHAARIRDEIRVIEDATREIRIETNEIEAQSRTARAQTEQNRAKADAFVRQVEQDKTKFEQDKIKAFHKCAADIERMKNPEIRDKATRMLLESSMGKAARRHFH